MLGESKHTVLDQTAAYLQRAASRCACFNSICFQGLEPPPPDGLRRIMVVGLGNYLIQYSRCSVGMTAVNVLARKLNVDDNWHFDRRCAGMIVLAIHGPYQIILLKPQKLMKVNGISVKRAAKIYQVTPKDIYMIHDQLHVPLGKFGFIKGGGIARGHTGVISCIYKLNSDIMPRLIIGIGSPPHKTKRGLLHHKLGRFSQMQEHTLMPMLEQCINYLLEVLDENEMPRENTQALTE
ncbi:probable peptidyl-tRNA hydrolase [Heptranchias perlo]|uniref:probable peptidyl-tRNA hydrolase n=1 Tax=Heptranchias perlo TaxID=212740 RepID=UPI00355A47FE